MGEACSTHVTRTAWTAFWSKNQLIEYLRFKDSVGVTA